MICNNSNVFGLIYKKIILWHVPIGWTLVFSWGQVRWPSMYFKDRLTSLNPPLYLLSDRLWHRSPPFCLVWCPRFPRTPQGAKKKKSQILFSLLPSPILTPIVASQNGTDSHCFALDIFTADPWIRNFLFLGIFVLVFLWIFCFYH